jgi:PAS domain S-box-containing protein
MSLSDSPKNILIVEDEQIIAHSIHRSLVRAGYSVAGVAASAAEAFECIERSKPDLVLMDIRIQGDMDGIEAAALVRSRFQLPIIFLTAHADAATLERAKLTEPLGYMVKPINHANLPSAIEIALHKHGMDRRVKEERTLFSGILETTAEAIIVTNSAGNVLFLNRAAEALTGWSEADIEGKPFESVFELASSTPLPSIATIFARAATLHLPLATKLRVRSGRSISVDGHIAVSRAEGRVSRAVITLFDSEKRDNEERKIRQEQKMHSVARLASDIAQDFYGLFDLVARSGEDLMNATAQDDESGQHSARVVRQAADAGASIARQLLDFGRNQAVRADLVNLNDVLEERRSLYERLCGRGISLCFNLSPALHPVLSHTMHLEKLALNLLMSAKHSMPGGGSVLVSTSNITKRTLDATGDKQWVKLIVEARRNTSLYPVDVSTLPNAANPELTLAVVNTIVTVHEGVLTTSHEHDLSCSTQVLLPAFVGGMTERSADPATLRVA